ncbi:MAG: fibronectin type III domain-containing protein, partial [Candidatus Oxydemutatoraceae bacterium WSBS_2016_MAG_OTU14]
DLNVAQGVQTYLISILTDTTEIGQQAIEVSANKYVFVGLRADTTYVLSVISNNAEAGFVRSERYTQAFRTRQMPQLDTPVLNKPELGDGSITLSWPAVVNAMAYTVYLYRGTDTSVRTSQSKVPTRNTSYTFSDLHPATEYTAEVQAQAEHYINSESATQTATTPQKKLSPPVRQDIETTATTNSLTVSLRNISSPVEEYVVDIALQNFTQNTQQNFMRPIQKLKASSRNEIAFTGLDPATKYALRIVSSADSTRYINSRAYTTVVRTDYLADLSSATLTAFTQNRRENIRVDWSRVAAAQAYIVNLYAGANNMDRSAIPMVAARVPAPQQTHTLSGIDRNAHHTVGVVAIADGYRTAFETRVSVLPRILQESLFKLERDHDSLSLSWRSDQMLDADFNSLPHLASLFISIKDSTGSVVNEETKISADRNAYFAEGLSARTNYVLNIVLRVAIDGTVLNSEALTISLQTLEQLPKPTRQQIRWVEGQSTLTVHWLNAPPSVTSYVLTLEGETTNLETVVDARSTGSTTFKGLNEGTTYTLSVVPNGDSRLYSPSDIFRVEIITDKRHQLSRPHVMLGVEDSVNISASWFPVDSATSYIVSLYRGDGRQERIGEPTTTSDTAYVFRNLSLVTNYTVAVTAQGRGLLNSAEGVGTIMTGQVVLPHPRGNDITLSATEDTIKVTWRGVVAEEVQTYLISIYPDTADIGQQARDVSLNEYSFKNLLSDTYYEVSIASSRDETGYVESAVYMEEAKTEFLPQLQKPTIDFLVVSDFSIVASWRAVSHEAAYTVNLYLGSDTSKPL